MVLICFLKQEDNHCDFRVMRLDIQDQPLVYTPSTSHMGYFITATIFYLLWIDQKALSHLFLNIKHGIIL